MLPWCQCSLVTLWWATACRVWGENRFTVTQPHQRKIPVFLHFLQHFFSLHLYFALSKPDHFTLHGFVSHDLVWYPFNWNVESSREKSKRRRDNQMTLFLLTCFDHECHCAQRLGYVFRLFWEMEADWNMIMMRVAAKRNSEDNADNTPHGLNNGQGRSVET